MNQKELNEIRRRWKLDRNAISRIYGCYVNSNKSVISTFDTSLGLMTQEETEMYLGLMKKTLSGTLGKNLIDIGFSTAQVADSEEHRLLMTLKNAALKDDEAREALFGRIIESLSLEESNYLILLAADSYDVPYRGKDDELQSDAGGEVFSYFLCCICPVKASELELRYHNESGEFRSCSTGQITTAPVLGFLFPCFDDRSSNIYNALYYAHNPALIHQELIDAVFRTQPPMTAPEQKDAFQTVMESTLAEECSFDVAQAVHEQIRSRIALHKEAKIPEMLALSANEMGDILKDSGLTAAKAASFQDECRRQFGDTPLNPTNIIDPRKFDVETPEVKISVAPENSYLLETRVIDGRRYILIPADSGVEVNGLHVSVGKEDE